MDIKGKRLRLLFSDVLGVERGKYLFGDVADAGHSAFCIGVYPLTTDKEILDISRQQFDVGLPDVEAFIDRDTLRPGWEEDTIVGIADVQQHGKALEVDPREVLRRAVEPWRAMGLEPMFAFESEFYLLDPGSDARPKSICALSWTPFSTSWQPAASGERCRRTSRHARQFSITSIYGATSVCGGESVLR